MQPAREKQGRSPAQRTWRDSVYWRVAVVLLAVQLLAVMVAVGLSANAAVDRALDLAAEGLRLRLDAVAEELEVRTDWDQGLSSLPAPLLVDLSSRFPDPLTIVDVTGNPLLVALPDGGILDGQLAEAMPPDLVASLGTGIIVTSRQDGWMIAPIYDDVGFLSGGIVIQPITQSLRRELLPARAALFQALVVSGLVVLALALVLAAAITYRLVQPLRLITSQVEAIGEGDYRRRVDYVGGDELGRLAETINYMAARVDRSIHDLQATDRMRRELVANVGHDLRTPLAAVLGRVEEAERMLAEGRKTEASGHLLSARKQAAYLKRLVDDLFELSVLDSPTPKLRLEPVPIAEIIRDVAEQFRDDLAARRVDLRVELPPGLPVIEADGVRLLRLLTNLLSNAARHTPDEGTIRISAGMEAAWVEVRVEDSGSGIEDDVLDKLFERYYRGTDARTRTTEGTGLGLAISRAAAQAHGGDLVATNREEGGACFTLRLPLATGA